jgi:hypothetical protein
MGILSSVVWRLVLFPCYVLQVFEEMVIKYRGQDIIVVVANANSDIVQVCVCVLVFVVLRCAVRHYPLLHGLIRLTSHP